MLKLIRLTTWEEVFQDWKQREGNDPGWIHCATVLKGWDSWESWRRFTAEQIKATDREWSLYELTDPMHEIPAMLVGPFTGWQSRLPAPNKHTFADLVRIPEQEDFFRAHEKVTSMVKDFPPLTMFIGLRLEGNDRIVCMEGHHRATAVALAALDKKSIDFGGSVHIALAALRTDEIHLLDNVLARGTSKDPQGTYKSSSEFIARS
ncbi:hypothetical protein HY630_03370 [Candidatus Uhrbacteria bacterium]|nr:hypothetical protein [Candidatus Uhrbacteria bacterium]